jgi:aminopeptidase YwaD
MLKFIKLTFILILCLSTTAFTQDQLSLLDPTVMDKLANALDGDQAKAYVTEICKYHRVQASPGYRQAAQYVLDQLKKFGFSDRDAYIESFPSDGIIQYQTWQSPPGWDIEDAELSIVEPIEEKISSFKETPMSLMTYSNPGDATSEVVWVGTGTKDDEYKNKSVKNKFVLATGSGEDVHRLAVIKYGAKGVVTYLDDKRGRENPSMVHYTGIWPKAAELQKVTFGFNISNSQGEKIKKLLEDSKKVVLHGWVKGKGNHSYFMDVVVAHIRGNERLLEELVFSAHLDHPKECANDNASGSAAILDIARSLKALIDSSALPRPKRSFRFLWVPEWNGTMAYLDKHPELAGPAEGGRFLANMNLDMVGENTELLHSKLYIFKTPYSVPSCLNDVVENVAQTVDRMNITVPGGSKSQFNYRIVPYSGGSDHMMFLDRKIPSIMLCHSDYTHHTNFDSPDKVDPLELERSEMIAAASLWYLANLSVGEGTDLIEYTRSRSYLRLGETARRVRKQIISASLPKLPIAWAETESIVSYAFQHEIEVANSIMTFNDDIKLFNPISQSQAHFGKRFDVLYTLPRSITEASGHASDMPPALNAKVDWRIPQRVTRGPFNFDLPVSSLPAKDAKWYASEDFPLKGDLRFELVNLINGKRNVSEIRNALSAYNTAIPDSVVSRYIDDLWKTGLIKFAPQKK